jgi:hypothetical protein
MRLETEAAIFTVVVLSAVVLGVVLGFMAFAMLR